MSNQKTSPVEAKSITGEFIPPDEAVSVASFSTSATPTLKQRDERLNLPPGGEPFAIGNAVQLFLEIRSLITGFKDEVAVPGLSNNEPVLKRNWCYPGLGPSLCPSSNFRDPIT